MGRELRRVFPDWQHPVDKQDRFIPQFARFVTKEMTAYQLYETITEGTPISPVCQTAEEMINWLAYYMTYAQAQEYETR